MSTHNICFYGEIRKIILKLSPNTPLDKSVGFVGCVGSLTAHSILLRLSRAGQLA